MTTTTMMMMMMMNIMMILMMIMMLMMMMINLQSIKQCIYFSLVISQIVVCFRNPKDVCTSYFHFYQSSSSFGKFTGDWEMFLDMFLCGHGKTIYLYQNSFFVLVNLKDNLLLPE